jgi:hypothetical protein
MLSLNIKPNQLAQASPVIGAPAVQAMQTTAQPTSLSPGLPMPVSPVINQGATMQQVPPTGLIGSEQALSGGLMGGMNALNAGAGTARSDIAGAMSGVNQLGTTNYAESPAAKFKMQQMQRAVERSAAAKGGLLSGNTALELQDRAAGIAAQDYENQFNRDLNKETLKATLSRDLADTAMSAGIQGAGLITQTAGQVSQGRTDAGKSIAQNATQAASSISQLLNQQGIALSDSMSKDISTITDFIYQSGMQDSLSSENLAAILANIAGGQASTVAQGYNKIGEANAAGTIGIGNAIVGGLQGYQEYKANQTKGA